ncbi:NAD-dependent succinate-semialdehyde dehydrogenase [Raineyella sp. W15-4]|uniref:NAD-dependent succinate-semialdehyde dehydrogenase n=1 Tax=Raineyella sp. W15-4 TaxID=3081651 RepID=UPI0029534984|nr:NAD-dependent succinate-semialdehyde dehydrogenase [Raineyella sp. W15-4]WOQ17286.1 NAD-dependent succinate-semialdehyde dehydrogenase [Raineyella sp. W15-4]
MSVDAVLSALPHGQFIAGTWRPSEAAFDVVNPATEEVIDRVADGTPEDARAALDAACDAARGWAGTAPRERAEVLRRAFDLVLERRDLFATCMTLEMGKPLPEAYGEVAYGAEFLRWFSEEAVRIEGRFSVAPSSGQRILTMKQPVGPVYAITPWNFPLAMGTRKLAPAIAAGCTAVIKPAHETPLTTLLFIQALQDAGLPAGVVNCLTSSHSAAVSEPIIADPRLRKLTFTGSTGVGRILLRQAADHVLKTSMELGGNAPFLVLPSADLDKAVQGALDAKMRNTGEACTAANRMYVHESVAAEFSTRLAEKMAALPVGNGLADGVRVGPLVSARQLTTVTDLLRDAVARGARVATGGGRPDGAGYFLQPTVLTDVPPDARVFREEIFGPVAPIATFATLDEAITLANATEFGLMAYVFAENLGEAAYVVERLESGMVGLNSGVISDPAAPFGGVKESGLGREGSHEGLEEYLETKYVGIRF